MTETETFPRQKLHPLGWILNLGAVLCSHSCSCNLLPSFTFKLSEHDLLQVYRQFGSYCLNEACGAFPSVAISKNVNRWIQSMLHKSTFCLSATTLATTT